jgi:hypothetical protein
MSLPSHFEALHFSLQTYLYRINAGVLALKLSEMGMSTAASTNMISARLTARLT